MPQTQLNPNQVRGLNEAYNDLQKLKDNTRGIKFAAWVTAIATVILAIAAIVSIFIQLQ